MGQKSIWARTYTFWNSLLNNYCYWPHVDYFMIAFCYKKSLGGQWTIFKWYVIFLKILGDQIQELPNDYLQICRESIVHLSIKNM